MTDFSYLQPVIDAAVPILITGAVGWVVKELYVIFPVLKSFLTAQRVAAAEQAITNATLSESADILAGRTTIKAVVTSKMDSLSAAAKTAMSANGTTEDQMILRATGNALTALATITPTVAARAVPAK